MAVHETTNLPPEWYRWTVQSINGYAIFTTDLNSRITTWDQGATALFGYRRDDVVGENARFIFTPEDIQQRVPELEIVNAVGRHAALDERWHVRKDGSIFWASGLMMVVTDDVGRQVGFVKVLREAQPPK
jgi:two-component system, chemotaxis family, CheB/CheR fusion protein